MDRVGNALGLVSDLTSAPSVAKAVDAFQQAVEPFGVNLYKTMVVGNVARTGGEQLLASNWPDEWDSFYRGARAFTFDPVAAEGMKNDGFYWRDLPEALTQEGRQLMLDARELGMADGFTAVRRTRGASPVVASVAGDHLDWNDLDRGVVTLVSNSLISRILYLRDIQISPMVQPLSVREKDLVRYASLGLSDKAIALELGITHETIRFYWKTIRRKLGATDRAHAVATAMWSGQMLP